MNLMVNYVFLFNLNILLVLCVFNLAFYNICQKLKVTEDNKRRICLFTVQVAYNIYIYIGNENITISSAESIKFTECDKISKKIKILC